MKKISGFIIIGIALAIVTILFLAFHELEQRGFTKPVIETNRSEVRKFPPDAKKKLEEASPSAIFRVPILLYHYVEYVRDPKDTIRMSLNINPYIFEEQVKALSDAHYTFMTVKELGEVMDEKKELPKNPVILTFDDGHWDLDTQVLPILKKYHAKATAYIISGFINGSDFLSKAQLLEVIDSGLVEIGAHTAHHISLKGNSLSLVKSEINDSKMMLEKEYHIQVVSFAYPNGAFDLPAAQVVKDDGFSTAVSTVPGIKQNQANRFYLHRLRPGGRMGEFFLNWLQKEVVSEYN
jgi:peptidoglycan/xylan/chitin deacetylase (PgdA/CDA1 family)